MTDLLLLMHQLLLLLIHDHPLILLHGHAVHALQVGDGLAPTALDGDP